MKRPVDAVMRWDRSQAGRVVRCELAGGVSADVHFVEVGRPPRLEPIRVDVHGALTLDVAALRRVPLGRIVAWANVSGLLVESGRITVPEDRPYGEDFYRQVAAVYVTAVREGEAPGPRLCALTGRPLTTAHRWVREARRRGLLPAAGPVGRAA